MRIAVITLHTPLNFGSALQAYALCRFLREMGHSVELIDYHRPAHSGLALIRRRFTDDNHTIFPRIWHFLSRTVEAVLQVINSQAFNGHTCP